MPISPDTNKIDERWLHDHHWDTPIEVVIVLAGIAGAQNLDVAVAANRKRRIREVTARFTGTANTVVSIIYDTIVKLSFDLPSQTTRVWSSQDGREFTAGQIPRVMASVVTGGTLYVTAAGVEV